MNKEKPNTQEQIWSSLFLVTPVILLTRFTDNFSNDSGSKILIAGVLGGIGGLLGWAVYTFIKRKTTLVKIIALIVLIGICITSIILATNFIQGRNA